jgi:L-aminopeptidase/D-esterase-like protein
MSKASKSATRLDSGDGTAAVRTGDSDSAAGKFSGKSFRRRHALNGNGEMTRPRLGITESGGLGSPVMITNTHSVGTVRDAVIDMGREKKQRRQLFGRFESAGRRRNLRRFLSDINGFHVNKTHVFQALDSAKSGAIAEGYVGGGTEWSRIVLKAERNRVARFGSETRRLYGRRSRAGELRNGGQFFFGRRVPVGREITDLLPVVERKRRVCFPLKENRRRRTRLIIVVVATDAPLCRIN